MKEIHRKLMLLGLIVLIGIGLIYTNNQGKKQDKVFLNDYQSFQVAMAQMQEGNHDEAQERLLELHNKYYDQANITRNLGLAYAIGDVMDKAALYYQKAVDQRPFIIQDPMFSLQFAEILYANEEYEAAKQYLEYCQNLAVPEEYRPRIDELLAHIETNN